MVLPDCVWPQDALSSHYFALLWEDGQYVNFRGAQCTFLKVFRFRVCGSPGPSAPIVVVVAVVIVVVFFFLKVQRGRRDGDPG